MKKKELFLSMLLCVVTTIFIVMYYQFIFGDNAYIFLSPNSDYLLLCFPFKNYLLSHFSIVLFGNAYGLGLGTNSFSSKFILIDPFNLLNILKINVSLLPIVMYYFKTLLLAVICFYALSLRTGSLFKTSIFVVLFVFSGMFIYWSTLDFNFTAITFIMLEWLGYEIYRKTRKLCWFILFSLPLFMFTWVYWVVVFNIFFVVYILLDTVWDANLQKTKVIFLSKLAMGYCVVLAISAWSILPELFVLAHNGRVSEHISTSVFHIKLNTQFGLIEPLDLYNLKLYSQFILRGVGNYTIPFDKIWVSAFSGPLWYSSLFVLVSAFAFIFQKFNNSLKIKLNLIIVLSVLFGLFPFVILLFNGFSDVRFRWTWFLLLPIFVCAVKFWQSKPDLNKFRIVIIVLSVLFCLAALYEYYAGDLYFTDKNVLYTYIEITIVFTLLFLVSYLRRYTFIFLACIGLGDTLFNAYIFIHNTQPIDVDYQVKHEYYYDNTINAVNKVKSEDKSVFYRMDKTYSSLNLCPYCGLNENLIQGYNGVKQYISTPNPAYFKFSADMDAKPYYNFIFGFDDRNDVLRVLGVKYILSKSESSISGYSYQQKVDDINIYLANNYQGIGHVFHNYITYDNFMSLSTTDKDLAFSRCTILNNQQISAVKVEPVTIANCLARDSVLSNNSESFNLEVLNGRHVLGSVNLLSNGILYLAIPYDQGFSAKVDGKDVPVLNVSDGFVGLELTAGKHSIELDYFPPLLKIGLIISGLTLLTIIIYGSVKKKLVKTHNE